MDLQRNLKMSLRIDKFIWFIRLSKTRTQAIELINKKRVLVNHKIVKPSKEILVGDIVSIVKFNAVFSYKIIEILSKRIGAALVQNYIIDVTPVEEKEKYNAYVESSKTYKMSGFGKPTKKDRRTLNDYIDHWDTVE